MCLTEFDEIAYERGLREEGREEGRMGMAFQCVQEGVFKDSGREVSVIYCRDESPDSLREASPFLKHAAYISKAL
jgi:hypothetical protein